MNEAAAAARVCQEALPSLAESSARLATAIQDSHSAHGGAHGTGDSSLPLRVACHACVMHSLDCNAAASVSILTLLSLLRWPSLGRDLPLRMQSHCHRPPVTRCCVCSTRHEVGESLGADCCGCWDRCGPRQQQQWWRRRRHAVGRVHLAAGLHRDSNPAGLIPGSHLGRQRTQGGVRSRWWRVGPGHQSCGSSSISTRVGVYHSSRWDSVEHAGGLRTRRGVSAEASACGRGEGAGPARHGARCCGGGCASAVCAEAQRS